MGGRSLVTYHIRKKSHQGRRECAMNDQKIENQLNLALEATEEEREKAVV